MLDCSCNQSAWWHCSSGLLLSPRKNTAHFCNLYVHFNDFQKHSTSCGSNYGIVYVQICACVVAEGISPPSAFLPAVVNKLIKEMVPNIRVSTDARDLLLNCCSGEWRGEAVEEGEGEAGRVGAVHPLTIISTSFPPAQSLFIWLHQRQMRYPNASKRKSSLQNMLLRPWWHWASRSTWRMSRRFTRSTKSRHQ